MTATPAGELAGELKFGQVSIANLRVLRLDREALVAEMADRVTKAPGLFDRAAVIVDFGSLSSTPSADEARALLDGLRDAGVCPVGIAFGSSSNEALARQLGLPSLAKFRAQYERSGEVAAPTPEPARPKAAAEAPRSAPTAAVEAIGRTERQPIRSGQQIYAQGRDLVVTATVGAGAEVIADGNIHVYGALRGRALAGAGGATDARIYCREFHAELVAIAGNYRVLEDIDPSLKGKAVQVWLDGETLRIEAMDA
ncbi:MAG: septum site-determining protein MinC [Rhodanobacteraceae bacterium]|nr:septum site-determining protein MinC [Xanthomonadales bacterium]MCP5477736.1 septum site-determining protein MinC [Rhodanobacteraceae bacterium]HRY00954.1 septum site-determining protein MinC [Xanthomonadaceae bacterium]